MSEALVVDKITNKLPICPVDIAQLSYLKDLRLSDDSFHIPDKIDGLIGAELFSCLIGKPKSLGNKGPIVIESKLGDIIMGRVPIIPLTTIVGMLLELVGVLDACETERVTSHILLIIRHIFRKVILVWDIQIISIVGL